MNDAEKVLKLTTLLKFSLSSNVLLMKHTLHYHYQCMSDKEQLQ
jgi:hypothetical protein